MKKQLREDGYYGAPINGYSEEGAALKEAFLRDAAALLRETGKCLASRGLSKSEITKSRAGVACSGEVYGRFWRPEDPTRRVMVEVGSTCLAIGRDDGVCVRAQWEEYEPVKLQRIGTGGPNQWISAALTSEELAERLLMIYDPEITPVLVSAHTRAAGTQPFPPFAISDPAEIPVWRGQFLAIRSAMETDTVNAEAIQLPLFDLTGADTVDA